MPLRTLAALGAGHWALLLIYGRGRHFRLCRAGVLDALAVLPVGALPLS